jgi:D-alanyl-D-alanine carboxypeptidase/D-alanyl-D-alanine-endopeptidase (penicillin-binding protein 4)
MANGPLRERWLELLPVAGRTGTVAGRLRDTPADGRVHAKTGTLRDVRALTATIPGRGGDDLHLAVVVNDLERPRDIAAARRLSDVLALALTVAQDGCGGPLVVSEPQEALRDLPERRICAVRRATHK